MDKQTLSNYGWVIITVLVLAVMIALATPFGSYIKEGAKSTLTGLFESSENALNTGLSEAGVTLNKAEFGGVPTVGGNTGSVSAENLNHSGMIPEGGVYVTGIKYDDFGNNSCCDSNGAWCWCDATTYKAGDNFPSTVQRYDVYAYGDYVYMYDGGNAYYGQAYNGCPYEINIDGVGIVVGFHSGSIINGWCVGINNTLGEGNTRASFGVILESINEKNITNIAQTFQCCSALIVAPTIPNSVTNMAYTFSDCTNLTTAPAIPNSVTDMGGTFHGCTNLTTAPVIPNSVTNMAYTFNNCTNLTTAPAIPSSVTNMIGTFDGCISLTTASTIPSSITDLSYTFYDCISLTTAPIIPNSVTNMGGTFSYCANLTTAPAIPNSVTDMGGTFHGCTNLTTAPVIPNSVTNMAGTFDGCTNLTTAPIIPNSVTNMDSTFYGCTNLTTAPMIPNSVTNMDSTFSGCTSLTGTITINANPTSYINCFYLSSTGKPITLTGSSTMLQELANTNNDFYRTITIQ